MGLVMGKVGLGKMRLSLRHSSPGSAVRRRRNITLSRDGHIKTKILSFARYSCFWITGANQTKYGDGSLRLSVSLHAYCTYISPNPLRRILVNDQRCIAFVKLNCSGQDRNPIMASIEASADSMLIIMFAVCSRVNPSMIYDRDR